MKVPLVAAEEKSADFTSSNHKIAIVLSDDPQEQKQQEYKEELPAAATKTDLPQTTSHHSAKLFQSCSTKAALTSDEALTSLWQIPQIISFG
jgi:hypothetical protein